MEEDRIISALIGLVGACNNNPKTENTDGVIIKALAFSMAQIETGSKGLQALIEEIYAEKHTVAPGCATCQTPCGNTSDYDMNRIYDAEADIRDLKLKILSVLKELAAELYSLQKWDTVPVESMEFFYKALLYVSFDMEREGLLTFWNEVQETLEKIRRKIQVWSGE